MSNARIIEIPATRQIRSGKNNTMRKMRVAAYCRVSTEDEEQQGSFETQKLYYTEKINSTSEWELAGIYADDGISGIHTKKRDGFNQMIQDCKKKKIDLILTKSISRFARNTLDSIQYVRMLKAIGIAVIFEKENINTSTMNSEMILTVLSAFAQAESESISQNVARGKRMGFRQGKFPFPYGQILGYRKGLDGKPEVIPEEAEVIRMIFNSYLQGASLLTIKKKLEAGGVLTARGNKKWSSESVQRILQNEKYCGDVLLQKTFIEDVLTGVSKKNTGQLPQYYIENNHEGIVTKQMFREVQAEIARRNSKSAANQRKRHQGRYNSKYALSERLVCGDCGSPYKRVTWNIHGRKQIVWRCVNRLEFTHTQTPALASRKRLLMRVLLFGKVSYYTMDTGSRIKLVREHRGLTQQKLGEMLGYGKSSANRIAQYEMGYRSPKANRLKEIAKAMNIREEIFLMPDETPIDLLRILIWYDWEHEGVLQLATSRTANTPPGKTVSPIIYSEQLPLNRLLLDWADQKHSLSVRKITRADYLEWMLQWPPRLP